MKLVRLLIILFLALPFASFAAPAFADAVRVTVNSSEITDTQISLRAGLLRLERRGSSNSQRLKMASDELVEEALKMQEAQRLGITIAEREVDEAFRNVARNLRMSVTNLNRVLSANGVNEGTLKDRLRAGLAWQKISQAAVMPRVQISDADLDAQARDQLDDQMSYDYLLKEVLFIIPANSGRSASSRTAEANQYRKSFQGCDTAVDLSLSYTDAAVIDVGRRHATQLPEALANELAGLQAGGITKPRVTDKGVSMLAVCTKTAARDTTFIKNQLRAEVGTEKLQEEADAYLERLRERAAINYR
jgi:peptidyl-prolyl cis-trans isomerase SurA